MRKIESLLAGSFCSFSFVLWVLAFIRLPDPLPPVAPPSCRHTPHGCCRHDLEVMVLWPDGPCTPDCARKMYRCPDATDTPGGNGSGAIRARHGN
jgi:hypothetical protein